MTAVDNVSAGVAAIVEVADRCFGGLLEMFVQHEWAERGNLMAATVREHVVQAYGSVEGFVGAFSAMTAAPAAALARHYEASLSSFDYGAGTIVDRPDEGAANGDGTTPLDDYDEPTLPPHISSALSVLTRKTFEDVKREGGSGWWRLNRANAANVKYVIMVRNRHASDGTTDEHEHNEAFLIGRVSGLDYDSKSRRTFFRFGFVAHVSMRDARQEGLRNPALYTSLETNNINPLDLTWFTLDGTYVAESLERRQSVQEGLRAQLRAVTSEMNRLAVMVDNLLS
jgi:hypothetical protein